MSYKPKLIKLVAKENCDFFFVFTQNIDFKNRRQFENWLYLTLIPEFKDSAYEIQIIY